MKNNILYILGLCMLLAGTVSCREEMELAGASQTDSPKVLVELPYSETVQASRSVSTGYAIKTLDVLAFDNNGKYLYTSQSKPLYTTDNGKSYLYTLAIEQKENHSQQSFVFIANMRSVLTSIATSFVGKGKEEILSKLTFRNCDWTQSQSGIPMWGETATAYNVTTAPAVLNSIKLVRAVAAIEVLVNGDLMEVHGLGNFKIEDIIPCDFADKGYVAPGSQNYTWENNRYTIKAPSVPDDAGTCNQYTLSAGTGVSSMQGMLFVPEFKTNDTKSQTQPSVLIGGYYGKENKEKKTWYKVNLIKGEKPIDVLRNVQYVLNITAVSGEGYDSADLAYKNPSQNMRTELTMTYDNAQGLTNVVYDSSTFLAASHAEINLTGEGGSIELLTNVAGGWTITGNPDWLTVSPGSGEKDRKATVQLIVKQPSQELRTGTLTVTAGRLTLSIKVNNKADNVYTYTTAVAQQLIDASALNGIPEAEFQLSGGVAFYGKYLYIGNSYHKIEGSTFTKRPSLIVYDMTTNKVVTTIESWEFNGQTLNFEGTTAYPDIIDDIVADSVDNRLYVMRRHSCVEVFDISNPESPTYVTRIGQSMVSSDNRYTFQNSSAVGVCERAVLIRAANVLNTYERSTITKENWQKIASKTSETKLMPRLGYQPRQFAVDPVTKDLWLTEYGNNTFKGLYQLVVSRMDEFPGKEYQYRDLRGIQFSLSYNPTGMVILKDKVYVLQSSGDIDIFDRSKLYPAATYGTRSHAAAEDVPRTRAVIENYAFGNMSKLYAADATGDSFWTCDTKNNKLVLVKIEKGTIEM